MITTSEKLDEQALRRHDGLLDPRAFEWRAQDIIGVIEDRRGEIGLNRAIDEAIEQFVDPEPNQELQRFGEVVALARRQALLQEWLDDDRERLHHGRLNHEELVRLGHHYETLRHEACVYNHKLRGVIELSGHFFSRDQLTDWLVSVSQGRHEWVRGEITGAISEVAVHAALQGLPELRGLRYATVEEDLAGYDFVCEWNGKMLTFDAKTGQYWPLNERKHGHSHIELSVPREAVHDFKLTHRGLNRLREEVRQALGGGRHSHGGPKYGGGRHFVNHPYRVAVHAG